MALDDHTRDLLDRTGALSAPRPYQVGPDAARAAMRARQAGDPPGPDMAGREDVRIEADAGFVQARILTPHGYPAGTICYIHGGGWVLGSMDGFENFARRLAEHTRCVTAVIDYRLAPEAPYPAALDDCWSAIVHLAGTVEAGHLPGPLILAGDSSGGNLVAVLARRAMEAGLVIGAQILVYPVVDCDLARASYLDQENQLLLDTPTMRWFWDQYAPDRALREHPELSPLRAGDFTGLPPAVILTAEHDILRDEGEEYAKRLEEAGVPVLPRRCLGQMHGFIGMAHLPGSDEALSWLAESLHALLPTGRGLESDGSGKDAT